MYLLPSPPLPSPQVDDESLCLVSFDDRHHVKLALQVLGLMCDGQYRLMQNYLREQRDNIVTINVVGEVALFLQYFYTELNAETMDLVHLILQTLIEMCVGNYPNQVVLHNRQIVEALNHILSIDIANPERSKCRIIDVRAHTHTHGHTHAHTHMATRMHTHTHRV